MINLFVILNQMRALNNKILFTDYYPFGTEMSGRRFLAAKAKYGFNGQLKDNEVYGEGNSTTAEFWQYDPRLGRRWNIDPEFKSFAYESPYVAFHNNPIFYNDPLGNKPGDPDKEAKKFGKKVDKELNAHKGEEGFTRDKAIEAVGAKLSFRDRYITYKERNNNGTDHSTVDIVEYYKTTLIDITKPSSTVTKVENTLKNEILNKGTATSFDEVYTIAPIAGAISKSVDLKNIGKTKGLVILTYDDGASTIENRIEVPSEKTVTVPLLKNTTYVQIELVIESIDQPGVSAKLDVPHVYSDVLKPNPNKNYIPYQTQGKPSKAGILERFKK